MIPGPINAWYGETVAGTAVIRAFGQQSVFIERKSLSWILDSADDRSTQRAECEAQCDCLASVHVTLAVW